MSAEVVWVEEEREWLPFCDACGWYGSPDPHLLIASDDAQEHNDERHGGVIA